MSFQATVINVFIASPSDIERERAIFRQTIQEWNDLHALDRGLVLLPMGWESHAWPMTGERPQEILNRQLLERCDLLVAAFGTRLGSPTGKAPSGTVEEIREHLLRGKPAMLYFSDAPVAPSSIDDDQHKALRTFRNECKTNSFFTTYGSIEDFRDSFRQHLMRVVLQIESAMRQAAQQDAPEIERRPSTISENAQALLLEASKAAGGEVMCIEVGEGLLLRTNEKEFAEMGNARSEAEWKAVLQGLVSQGMLEAFGDSGRLFRLTHSGYVFADGLQQLE